MTAALRKSLTLKHPTVFAPLEGVTHPELRRIMIARGGLGMVCTEFVRVHTNRPGQAHLSAEVEKIPGTPLSVQCMGSDPELLAQAAKIVSQAGADVVDLNVGCPTKRAARSGVGAALLKDIGLLREIVAAMRTRVPGLLSAKIRAGFDAAHHAVRIAQTVQDAGADFIAVHPRRRCDGYAGVADWRIIGAIKRELDIPVIGNGDCWYAADVARMMRETGCDAVMIGRPALRNPWIFTQAESLIQGNTPSQPTGAEMAEWLRFISDAYQAYFSAAPHIVIGKVKELVRYLGRAVNDNRQFMRAALRKNTLEELLAFADAELSPRPAAEIDLQATGHLGLETSGQG